MPTTRTPCFEAAVQFARTEGILVAPETSHAVRAAIDEALDAKAKDEKRVIIFNLSGHGHFDMAAYDSYLSGQLQDYAMSEDELAQSLATLPQVTEAGRRLRSPQDVVRDCCDYVTVPIFDSGLFRR